MFGWQLYLMRRATKDAGEAAKAARDSADAAIVASMPILSPLIDYNTTRLHDEVLYYNISGALLPFTSQVHFVFENFGKTPGVIRDLRADIFLTDRNKFPSVDFNQLPYIEYKPIVAGDLKGKNAITAVAERKKSFSLTEAEFITLKAEGGKRFALIGQVTYDDFFGNRHVRRFSVKMKHVEDNGFFQVVSGGRAYNDIQRFKIPDNDPLVRQRAQYP
jgi:hypothetical protein